MTKQELEARAKELESKLAEKSAKLAKVQATSFSEAKIRKACEDLYLQAIKRSAVWREWEMQGFKQEDVDFQRKIYKQELDNFAGGVMVLKKLLSENPNCGCLDFLDTSIQTAIKLRATDPEVQAIQARATFVGNKYAGYKAAQEMGLTEVAEHCRNCPYSQAYGEKAPCWDCDDWQKINAARAEAEAKKQDNGGHRYSAGTGGR